MVHSPFETARVSVSVFKIHFGSLVLTQLAVRCMAQLSESVQSRRSVRGLSVRELRYEGYLSGHWHGH